MVIYLSMKSHINNNWNSFLLQELFSPFTERKILVALQLYRIHTLAAVWFLSFQTSCLTNFPATQTAVWSPHRKITEDTASGAPASCFGLSSLCCCFVCVRFFEDFCLTGEVCFSGFLWRHFPCLCAFVRVCVQ